MNSPVNSLYLYLAQSSELPLDTETAYAELTPQTRGRADKKGNPSLRSDFIIAHTCLDWVLKRHFGGSLEGCSLLENAHGKPYLVSANNSITGFNLSHSHGYIAILCGPAENQVGVDCEASQKSNFKALAERFFAPEEVSALESYFKTTDAQKAFLATWTRKEAWIKMLGLGLQRPLDSFIVSTDPYLKPDQPWMLCDGEDADATEKFTATTQFKDGTPVSVASDLPHAGTRLHIHQIIFSGGKLSLVDQD